MKELAPGMYEDDAGGLNVNMAEFLRDGGIPNTPENKKAAVEAWREIAGERGIPFYLEN